MSENNSSSSASVSVVPWGLLFVILKFGTAWLIHWSWWWLLFPVAPDVVWFLRAILHAI